MIIFICKRRLHNVTEWISARVGMNHSIFIAKNCVAFLKNISSKGQLNWMEFIL